MLTFYITMSTIIVHVAFLLIFIGFPRFRPHYLFYVDKSWTNCHLWTNLSFFLFLTIPYFIRVCEVIYRNSFYTFCHFHKVVETPIFIILIIFIILLIFQGFIVLVTYYIYNIYSIFVIINISLLQTNRKQCLHSFTTVIILSISYIYQCAFCIFAHSLYYKYLFLSMNLSNYLYLIISSIISDFVILSKTSVANRLDFSVLEI